jgi:hypothetical protein
MGHKVFLEEELDTVGESWRRPKAHALGPQAVLYRPRTLARQKLSGNAISVMTSTTTILRIESSRRMSGKSVRWLTVF